MFLLQHCPEQQMLASAASQNFEEKVGQPERCPAPEISQAGQHLKSQLRVNRNLRVTILLQPAAVVEQQNLQVFSDAK